MTMSIRVQHASPNYPAAAVLARSGGYPEQRAVGTGPAVERYIHTGSSCVVHEVPQGQTIEEAEDRALNRMWSAYAAQGGGKTFDGKPLPTWAELGEERQACWRAALRAL